MRRWGRLVRTRRPAARAACGRQEKRRSVRPVAIPLVAVALVLSGCSGGRSATSPQATTSSAVSEQSGNTTDSTIPPVSAVPTSTASTTTPTAPTPDLSITAFVTPTSNIGCVLSAGTARCDIGDRTWRPPPKPATCNLDWGNGLVLAASGPGEVSCAGDTVLGATTVVLAYGRRTRVGPDVCDSELSGVTCTNVISRHGFFLSRADYRVF